MNRTIKEATVKRFYYDSHDQLRRHLDSFMAAYNFARRLKTLRGLISYEFVCKRWTSAPERFTLIHSTKCRDWTTRPKALDGVAVVEDPFLAGKMHLVALPGDR